MDTIVSSPSFFALLTVALLLVVGAGCTSQQKTTTPTAKAVDSHTASTANATDTNTPAAAEKPQLPATDDPSIPGKLDKVPALHTSSSLTNAEWRKVLSKKQYYVLREEGTERAFTGEYWNHKGEGTYHCAACGAPLFASTDKFKSGTGWPSYTRPVHDKRVDTKTDRKFGMSRTEVHCAHCGGHLGHVFTDGPAPTGLRYCINSASLEFSPAQ